MTSTPRPKALPTATSSGSAPTSLQRMRLLRDTLLTKLGGVNRLRPFAKGDVLVSEGDAIGGSMAFLVISGSLTERMTRYVKGRGDVSIPLVVPPGAITNIQVFVPGYSEQPSMVTIMAEEDGEAVLLDPAGIRELKEFGTILRGMIRKNVSTVEALWESREIAAELEETKFGLEWTEQEFARECERTTALSKERDGALEQARQARIAMHESVSGLDNERIRMTYVGIGMELYLDRIQELLRRRGVPNALLNFTNEEKLLFTGERPDNLDELRATVMRARQMDKIDDDLDLLLESLDADPPEHVIQIADAEIELIDPKEITDLRDTPQKEVGRYAMHRPRLVTIGYEEPRPDAVPPQKKK